MRHVTAVLAKLGVDNRTAATNVAVRQGLVWGRRRSPRPGDLTHTVRAAIPFRTG